ncbi:MAG: hypothetical protein LBB74_09435 [Chitinispirillales bacterium]|jgi:hypothetical protein|nr:hypothetical protein [Chitinispirillales bacterium]
MATRETYDRVIDDLAADIVGKHTHWNVDGAKETAWFICRELERFRGKLIDRYIAVNNEIKSDYMNDVEGLLDRHKVAAAFMIAFLEIIEFPPEIENNHKAVNGKLSLYVGLSLMATMIRGGLKKLERKKESGEPFCGAEYQGYKDIVEFLERHDGDFVLPNVICDEPAYRHTWALELHYAREKGLLFALSIANELFCIETYNRQLAKVEIAGKRCQRDGTALPQ